MSEGAREESINGGSAQRVSSSASSFTLYVHLPYCVKKCPYCDFNSYGIGAGPLGDREERYIEAVIAELAFCASEDGWRGRKVKTLFFGGGTPSLFSDRSIERVLSKVRHSWGFLPDSEITLECNPGTVQERLGEDRLRGFLKAGVNRFSFGAQSFSPRKLELLGRIHSGDETANAVEAARRAGCENFNLDLMFGTAGESFSEWRDDLERVLALRPHHISAYGLTIEPGTDFGRGTKQGRVFTADEDLQAELYEYTQERLVTAGYRQYEISNYALPGAECRHNLHYWRGGDYLAIGAGAHGYRAAIPRHDQHGPWGYRWSNIPGPEHYIEQVKKGGTGRHRREEVFREKSELEFLFLRLRCVEGISFTEYRALFAEDFEGRYGSTIATLKEQHLVEHGEDFVRFSKKGFLFADTVISLFAEESASKR